ncbi:MAG: M6 family metalloprotease domain-containing protein [Ignavibacteria bacterium]|nr:M6 family metalloprotease domain-containing protein [Ignavibacteria bacterium]
MKRSVSGLPIMVVGLLIAVATAIAAPLTFVPQTLRQPDGSILECFASGDEYYNWLHDKDGYTIVQDHANGYYVYATKSDGRLLPTAHVAGRSNPVSIGIDRWLKTDARHLVNAAPFFKASADRNPPGITTPTIGRINNLVIFIRFSDEEERKDSLKVYEAMCNTPGVNSMRAYFEEVSYKKLTISTTFYPAPAAGLIVSYKDSMPRSYFKPYDATTCPDGYQADRTEREHALLQRAVQAVASQLPDTLDIDADKDGAIDNICFIVSGQPTAWSSLLWPHMWSLDSRTVTMRGIRVRTYNFQLQGALGNGVLCHEMFHSLGAPDLYHYSSNGLSPAGRWDVMESNANPPQHMTAWMKYRYGKWIDAVPEIRTPGTYTLKPTTSATDNIFKIASPYSTSEFFVVEYRKRGGVFETSLPGDGLIVYRINSACRGNAGGPPDELYIYRPNGTLTANGQPDLAAYSATALRTAINDNTNPSSFLSNGKKGGLNIAAVTAAGATISFGVVLDTQAVQLTAPIRNSQWVAGSVRKINWLSNAVARKFQVEYSVNNGGSWDVIASPVTKPFYWKVPDRASLHCKMRIVDVMNSTVRDSTSFAICKPFYKIQFNNDVTDTTRSKDNLGVVFIGDQFWTSRAGSDYLYRWTLDGQLVGEFTISGAAAIKALTFDGSFVYAATGSNRIPKIDPLTRNRVALLQMPAKAEYCTFDPGADGGKGGLWIGEANSDIVLASMAGKELARIPAATHQLSEIMGLAYDGHTAGGPYLWAFCRNGGAGNPQYLIRLSLRTGEQTDLFHDVLQDIGSTSIDGLAGGLFVSPNIVTGRYTLIGTLLGTPNRLFGYELPDSAQTLLFDENFAYPAAAKVTDHGWSLDNGYAASPVTMADEGLFYMNYINSNIGRSARLRGGMDNRQNVRHPFPSVSSEGAYAALLLHVEAASAEPAQFLSLTPSGSSGPAGAHVYVRRAANGRLAFGVSTTHPSPAVRWSDSTAQLGKTHLIALHYRFTSFGTDDDSLSLWVNPPVSCFEPLAHVVHGGTGVPLADIGSVSLKQTDSPAFDLRVDGIRVATTWDEAVDRGMPAFSRSVLVLDFTDEAEEPFKALGVADSTVDSFYEDLFQPSATWDFAKQGLPSRTLLGMHQFIVVHADNPAVNAPHPVSRQDMIELLQEYVDAGGRLLLTGWRLLPSFAHGRTLPLSFAPGSFAYEYLHIDSLGETDADRGDFTQGAGQSGFSAVDIDSAKIPLQPYRGALSQVSLVLGRTDSTDIISIYGNKINSPTPAWRGLPVGVRAHTPTSDIFTLGYPLYFADRDDARRLAKEILGSVGVTPVPLVIEREAPATVTGFSIAQNAPNPFRGATTLRFTVPARTAMTLAVHDLLGREVARLADGVFDAGLYRAQWTATVPPGVYFCVATARALDATSASWRGVIRMVVLR